MVEMARLIVIFCIVEFSSAANWVPPCSAQGNCVSAIECYACADTEFQVFSNGVAGYPAQRECSARVKNCLYCWRNKYAVTYADGWTSSFQYKSCVPFPTATTCTGTNCPGEFAYYKTDNCNQYTVQKTASACLDGTWCMKDTTECVCSSPLCNFASRAQIQHLVTSFLAGTFLILLARKCCTVS
uniref:EGF-like domain-containing protein n=1 Tax=Cryptomonas curvata TaxID=233186 RepID=A0A7S0LUL5_9CRYP|mmetsp:Transcript_1110/g.2395  ORF Transcript_1110/g.2395 Transcript_1110/m.2395 type:complete len:185 (+) Transcript_1110:157-711(+)